MKRKDDQAVHEADAPAAEDPAEALTGSVEQIVYRSESTGYTVCSVRVAGRPDPVTVVGNCAALWSGETVRAEGQWIRHPRHGYQFQASSITCVVPTSARGIERYLASGMIRGIGKVMAARLVEAFGDETLTVIDQHSKRLEEVEGIGPMRRRMIKESWVEQKAVRDIMIFLQGHGVGAAQSARIYRSYGNDAIAIITENPYRLCRDIWGIGFKSADKVAMSLGIPLQSEVRARAGLAYVMQTQADEGHCFCSLAQLILDAQTLLEIPPEVLHPALEHEIQAGALVRENDFIYLAGLHEAETATANRLLALHARPSAFRPIVVDRALEWAAERMRITFDATQLEALSMALTEKVSVITGGPGVGKTTIIRALADVFGARGLRLSLAAPTGRAAKRMEEATGRPAATIHRLLKYNPQLHAFDFNAANPLETDVVILDECSMIDILLMRQFLDALPDACCLVLVGDTDQLPSVGPGNVLRDIIASGRVPCCRLETIFRQETGGWIVRNAHRVNRGDPIEMPDDRDNSDFFFLSADGADDVVAKMLELVTKRIPRRFGFDPLADIQVLTPMRRLQLGADNLNGVLQEALNPSGPSLSRFGRQYRLHDRVMQIRNNYDKEVFNGDIGSITAVDMTDQALTVDYDGRTVRYEAVELDELMHAYACSIHKSQGSEYPAVVVLLTTQHFRLLQRNLLYTALTRGRKLVCLIGQPRAVHMAIRNNEITLRRTSLCRRLERGEAGRGPVNAEP